MDKNLVEKANFNESKLRTTETVKVPFDTTETAKDRPVQDDCQSTTLDEIDAGNEHLEDKLGPETTSYEGSLSMETVITSSPISIKHKCNVYSFLIKKTLRRHFIIFTLFFQSVLSMLYHINPYAYQYCRCPVDQKGLLLPSCFYILY